KFGATTLWGDAVTLKKGTSTNTASFDFQLFNAGATNSQKLGGLAVLSTTGAPTVAGNGAFGTSPTTPVYGTAAEDTTAAKTFAITCQLSGANANITFTRQYVVTEFLQ